MLEFLQITLLGAVVYLVWDTKKVSLPKIYRKTTRRMILDTCALIDGRITQLSHSGFVPDELIVPEFVLHELQLLADGADPHKRERARFGLDVVKELQDSRNCIVVIDHAVIPDKHATDDKLVALAKKRGAQLYTTDYNLNKVAEIEGVKVLNVNELAQHLRPVALPGEHKSVKIVQKGSNPKQGVGYLDDGTMVVVEDAAGYIGKTVTAEVTRMHQTVAGKMLFGDLVGKPKQVVSAADTSPRLAARKPSNAVMTRLRTKRSIR